MRKRSPGPPPPTSRTDPVTAYAQAVADRLIVAGPLIRLACKRHLDDLEHGHERGLTFSLDLVDRAIGFFSDVLRLNGGVHEGDPFILEPWQAFIVGSLFGWLADDGFRRFRTAYIEIGKGNGKSPLAAGIGLYCLTADNEPRAEVYAAATKKDQAMVLFRDAVAMVDLSPELHSRIVQTGGRAPWNLAFPAQNSFFRAISSDDGQSGPRPHCSLIDEVHEHTNSGVVDMLDAGQKGRRQPLNVEITNSGVDRTSICFQHHAYSDRVVNRLEENDEWFAFVCGMDEGDDPMRDESCWPKANPNLGVSVTHKYLRKQVREARGMPAKASFVKRLNFCMWVDAASPWIDGQLWLACEDEFDPSEVLAACKEIVGALDLSGTRDLTALTLAGELESAAGTEIVASTEFWTPKDTLVDRSAEDKVPYDAWVEQGWMTATPGRNVDYRWVAQRLVELQVEFPNFKRCCFDTYRIKYLEKELDELGCEIELIPHNQGYYKAHDKTPEEQEKALKALKPGEKSKMNMWMPRSVELLEKAVGDGRFRVRRNPCLQWNSASAVLEADQKNNRIFSKRKSRGRIDGIVTCAMAVGLLGEGAPPTVPPRKYQIFTV